ncbi:DegT/DnrJ/EryC1/StrS family aminotransferase [Litoreibacter albidus]|uniref:DegT/DnrJ/EryC1/StrS family aminotransferase n=1 Tax=Litoreibacter albidus TaxID=670155 RepID=UPI003736ECB6
MQRFAKSFTEQPALPQASLDAAARVLASARLHRYQADAAGCFEVANLEQEFAAWQSAKYCLAVTSGGQALQIAMRAIGVQHNEPVLTNAFTLAPVPGAIRAVGGAPILVETTQDLVIDLDDLKAKAEASGARVLVLSHMRGHLVDMDALMRVAKGCALTVIEDCAHTMGATWHGIKSGNFGKIACFSTQTYKHINSGEGGFITSDDPDAMARATIMSGSYMNFDRHAASPTEQHFTTAKYDCPNMSARMDTLRAAILRPQLGTLDQDVATWKKLGATFEAALAGAAHLRIPSRPDAACRVPSSVQFRLPAFSAEQCERFCEAALHRGIEVKWFGKSTPERYTSSFHHWHYIPRQSMPNTDAVLATLFDLRLPLTFDVDDCRALAAIIVETASAALSEVAA